MQTRELHDYCERCGWTIAGEYVCTGTGFQPSAPSKSAIIDYPVRKHGMKPQRQLEGQPRKIVGFHQDEKLDWVAELECGHQQPVRHNPPWYPHWVTTAEGRKAHIGHVLPCLACNRPPARET